ncbi:MAG: TIGR04053 family radical SAM/SPASM domain-containing protein [Verrucomicrobia bacterium]|nr:TIGR04053 family radical SAM/SPASM domain-containing protein [Verrucomicrobiota bacterium]
MNTLVRTKPLGIEGYKFEERPFLVFWEITRACALACSHCRAEAQPRRSPDELNRSVALHLVEQLADLNPPMLVLIGGDPLMRPDALNIARYATELGLNVSLSPSATARLVKADFNKFVDAGIKRISLSLDGATRETHDAFRGLAGTYDRTMLAIDKAKKVGLGVQINTTLTRGNIKEYPAFRDLVFQIEPEMWSVFIIVPTGRAGLRDLPEKEDLEDIFEELADLAASVPFGIKTTEGHHFRRVLLQRKRSREGKGMKAPLGIRDGRGIMFIGHDGVVTPSGFLPIKCGNVRNTHPADIYRNHPLFVSLRDSDALGGKCGRCEFRDTCGGSRSRAWAVSGDPFAEEPLCPYIPAGNNDFS